MNALWAESPQTAEQIIQSLEKSQSWQGATIKTLLNRLLKKNAIAAEQDGRRYLYSPLLGREQWQAQACEGFLAQVFGGQIAPLFAHLSQHRRLSPDDLKAVKKLVDGMHDGN